MSAPSLVRALAPIAAIAILALAAVPAAATPVPCAGGTIDFTAASDTPVTLPTFNVGQKVILTAVPVSITPSTYSWTIAGPHIKDYEERIGTTLTGGFSWSTTPLSAGDLSAAAVSFYWKPAANQIHPLNAGASSRNVTLDITVGLTTCSVSQTFSVERNAVDIDKQAVDFFTSNHRAVGETNPEKGVVIDYHMEWHTVAGTRLLTFLPWHREFIARHDAWLAEFGYPAVVPWYPGTPIPTGPDIDHVTRLGSFDPDTNRIPTWYTMAGGTGDDPMAGGIAAALGELQTAHADVSSAIEFSWHGTCIATSVRTSSAACATSPRRRTRSSCAGTSSSTWSTRASATRRASPAPPVPSPTRTAGWATTPPTSPTTARRRRAAPST